MLSERNYGGIFLKMNSKRVYTAHGRAPVALRLQVGHSLQRLTAHAHEVFVELELFSWNNPRGLPNEVKHKRNSRIHENRIFAQL